MNDHHFFGSIAQLGLADLRWVWGGVALLTTFHPPFGSSRKPRSVPFMARAEAQEEELIV